MQRLAARWHDLTLVPSGLVLDPRAWRGRLHEGLRARRAHAIAVIHPKLTQWLRPYDRLAERARNLFR